MRAEKEIKDKHNFLSKNTAFDYVNMFFLVIIGLITLLPVLQVFSKAMSAEGPVVAGQVTFWPIGFQLDTVWYVIGKGEFQDSFLVSAITTVVGTAIAMFITVTCAYPLSKPALVGRKPLLYLCAFCMLFGAGMVPNYILYRSLKLTNTIWALIFPGVFSVSNMFIVKNSFEALPESIEEAALIDGANNITTMVKIILPMSMPVLATMTLFYAVGYWNNYMSGVLYITRTNLRPLQQYLYGLVREAMQETDAAGNVKDIDASMNLVGESVRAATIVASTVPILVVYPFLQKYFVKGITIGSVKG